MKCLRKGCGNPVTHTAFCSGRCKHIYRSGQDPDLCATCQDRPAAAKGKLQGYCSIKCQRLN